LLKVYRWQQVAAARVLRQALPERPWVAVAVVQPQALLLEPQVLEPGQNCQRVLHHQKNPNDSALYQLGVQDFLVLNGEFPDPQTETLFWASLMNHLVLLLGRL
jgi:hypothetical protein